MLLCDPRSASSSFWLFRFVYSSNARMQSRLVLSAHHRGLFSCLNSKLKKTPFLLLSFCSIIKTHDAAVLTGKFINVDNRAILFDLLRCSSYPITRGKFTIAHWTDLTEENGHIGSGGQN